MTDQTLKLTGSGALCGLLVSAPALSLLWAASVGLGAPFPPAVAGDAAASWSGEGPTRLTEAMAAALGTLGVRDAAALPLASQLLAVIAALLLGVLAGAALFALVSPARGEKNPRSGRLTGLVLGAAAGLPLAWLELQRTPGGSGEPTRISALWVLVSVVAWALALGLLRDRLARGRWLAETAAAGPADRQAWQPAQVDEASTGEDGPRDAAQGDPDPWLRDRRQVLSRLAKASVVLTLLGAAAGLLLGG